MKDDGHNARKVAPRIVPMTPVRGENPARAEKSSFPVPVRPVTRFRSLNGPVIPGHRTSSVSDETGNPDDEDTVSATGATVSNDNINAESPPGFKLTERVDGRRPQENGDGEVSPVVIWERTFQSEDVIPGSPRLPMWADNVSAVPTEHEHAQLSIYLNFLVEGFTNFCTNPDTLSHGNWQARMRMPPALLPNTFLLVDLSPLHAKLKFETDHAISRTILTRNIETLQVQVREALADSRDVEVSVW